MIGDILQMQMLDEPRPEGPVSYGGPFAPALIESLDATQMQDRLWPIFRDLWERTQEAPVPSMWIHLNKRLPIASGLGGGSGDFAAIGRLVQSLLPDDPTQRQRGEAIIASAVASWGADVSVCWHQRAAMMEGIGEELAFIQDMPGFDMLLVTLPIACHTPALYAALTFFHEAEDVLPLRWHSLDALVAWLRDRGNDFEPLVTSLHPEIGRLLEDIRRSEGCLLGRMSGSGSTCFAIFHDRDALLEATRRMREAWPAAWIYVAPVPGVIDGRECLP
jgi:4-diphosphocytidyl-2-C-methyl-D-erythritol kinase